MRAVRAVLVGCLVAGCALSEPPPPPLTIPAPEDLSTWSVPEVVTPVASAPLPQRLVVKDVPPTSAEKVYAYTPGGTYAAPVGMGFPLDIVFGRGEEMRNYTDGDREPQEQQAKRWVFHPGKDGVGPDERQHLFVTVSEAGLRNGLTITTTKRTYYVTLESVARSPIRVLRWKQDPPPADVTPVVPHTPGPLPPLDGPLHYHVGYVLESPRQPAPSWTPRQVLDDGKKLYIVYPEVTLFESVPLVRLIGPNGPQLVNARQYLNVVILDQLAARLELRVGIGEGAEVVTISRGRLRTIQCPEDAACPQWPAAARTLTRSTP